VVGMEYRDYWNTGCKIFSLEQGINGKLPTFEKECRSEKEAEETAYEWQKMENERIENL
jgi:hypothetical protein